MNQEKMQQLFSIADELKVLQENFEHFLEDIGLKGKYGRAGYDWYDCSFDLKDCDPSLELSQEQLERFWEIGFTDGWVHFLPGYIPEYAHYHKPRKL